jgi:hypothetical protein
MQQNKQIKKLTTETLRKAAKELQEVMDCYDPPIAVDTDDRDKLIADLNAASMLVFPDADKLSYETWKVLYAYTPQRPLYNIDSLIKAQKTKRMKKKIYPSVVRMLKNRKSCTKQELLQMLVDRTWHKSKEYLEERLDEYLSKHIPRQYDLRKYKNGRYGIDV